MGFLRSFIFGCRDFILPFNCIFCNKKLHGGLEWLCLTCYGLLQNAKDIQLDWEDVLPDNSIKPSLVFALWEYHKGQPIQKIQHQLKYKKGVSIGLYFGKMMGNAFIARSHLCDTPKPDLVLPIPLHRQRFLERGYNQSAKLASSMAEALHCDYSDQILVRVRPTLTQTGLSRLERKKNVANAFAIKNSNITDGQHIILVDDVLTTGATLLAAAHTLLQQHRVEISLAVLAHAPAEAL